VSFRTTPQLAVLTILFALLSGNTFAQQKTSGKTIVSKAESYINALAQQGRFSGAVLIARNGKVILEKGYGIANLEFNVPNTPRTKFRLASMTKAFTAVAIMMLQERGQLDIRDSICKYVPDCPPTWPPVTLKHLLNHTSGITEFGKPPAKDDCFRRTPMTTAQALERARQFSSDFGPGEKFAYSSQGYVLLGYVIEKVSGKSYEDFLKENIFAPLKMNETGLDRHKTILKGRASGYARAPDGTLSNFDYFNLDYLFSAGGLYSTVEDLYLWEQALYTEKLVRAKTLEEVFTPSLENFGYAWEILPKFNRPFIRAGGRSFGFSSALTRYPADQVTVIVLSNIDTAGAGKIAEDLGAIIFGEKYENPVQNK
jgi:CubicO group peptidase (beta-lactamase class C family)